jgi:hypothetical protein
MSKIMLLVLLTVVLAGAVGCKSRSGSREYIPGKGWKQN